MNSALRASGLPGPGPAAAWRPSRPARSPEGRSRCAAPGTLARLAASPKGRLGPLGGSPRREFPACGRAALPALLLKRGVGWGDAAGGPGASPPSERGAEPVPKGSFPAHRMRIVDDDDVSWKSRPADEGKEEEEEADESDLPVVSRGRPGLAGTFLAGCLQCRGLWLMFHGQVPKQSDETRRAHGGETA